MTYHFGPRWTDQGVEFRLWAPAASRVELILEDPGPNPAGSAPRSCYPMSCQERGWWRSTALERPEGTPYLFRINGEHLVPDPASRQQLQDVHGPSLLVAPNSRAPSFSRRTWEELVFYEVHVGTATPEGTFAALEERLPELAALGITALELMPLADFPGKRNWGYDGVLPFAPDTTYGTPAELKHLAEAAHRAGLSLWLDVVYNHFGPEGNYLHLYAPQFFTTDQQTPWGAAIDFTVPEVRRFFLENGIYWTRDMGFDGLRLDAVHAIHDPSEEHFLSSFSRDLHASQEQKRTIFLVLENDQNEALYLQETDSPPGYAPEYDGQWNDDIHHVFHVLLTREDHGYYSEYQNDPEKLLLQALAGGFIRHGPTTLPPARFIAFLQNHDQIGNRAFGERLVTLAPKEALEAATAVLLLAPQIPLLFMGEPWGCSTPFQFFCDFSADLAEAVKTGRRSEFGLEDLPDPGAPGTWQASRLQHPPGPENGQWLHLHRKLLTLRREHLVPLLPHLKAGRATGGGETAATVLWDPSWGMHLNLHNRARPLPENLFIEQDNPLPGEIFRLPDQGWPDNGHMPPWSCIVFWRTP
ncbi:maltooligosyl trehalose hydrolase [Alkalispirochaeta americana]|uniref:Malto-oligosyltrehalose trehalohydrolase n=1 Tax=Alkalispirochaeta americana TaxID=159291 RepID=A0A1N6PQF1_9SPIO|nr:malto-oligosyltrehalose trehalohydrolase [Alkalispirochaeta americana]SIQ06551.1 maltooligosyl trehalose hydrolase [Alkalispirochaeta americana]